MENQVAVCRGTRVPAAALVYVMQSVFSFSDAANHVVSGRDIDSRGGDLKTLCNMRHCWSCWQASYFT
jgi:hypothetical protein